MTKPDLIIHPLYAKLLGEYQLDSLYNVLELSDLQITVDDGDGAVLLADDERCVPVSTVLTPFYSNVLIRESGSRPHVTSYYFDKPTPLYKVAQRSPRYVIWTLKDPLTVCATCVDRVSICDLYGAVCRARQWAFYIERTASIIIYDLDRTLIDDNDAIMDGAVDALINARRSYDYVVLWSHGSPLHVDDAVISLRRAVLTRIRKGQDVRYNDDGAFDADGLFDLIISNEYANERANKNLLYLYNYFTGCTFSRAVLVDDSLYNWTPEYDRIIIPSGSTLVPVMPFV